MLYGSKKAYPDCLVRPRYFNIHTSQFNLNTDTVTFTFHTEPWKPDSSIHKEKANNKTRECSFRSNHPNPDNNSPTDNCRYFSKHREYINSEVSSEPPIQLYCFANMLCAQSLPVHLSYSVQALWSYRYNPWSNL